MCWKRREKEAIRYENWKWVRNLTGTYLFDLSKDLAEDNNLFETMPEKAKEMEERFRDWQKRMDAVEPRGPFRDF